MVDTSWWNYTSGVAWDSESDPGFTTYGQPSEYYIEASTNGTTWVQLAHITGEHYTGRQFAFNFTGAGYTQVRMRIVSIAGSHAGYDTFSINGAAQGTSTADTFLLLGDSITANCWAAANNTGPIEQFGTQIEAALPNRFPVMTIGGQSGWLTSTALSTSTYGIPNIGEFLNDMPAVEYVGLSLGTNDANGDVSSATYYSNMQTLVQDILAAGKIPIIPTIVASPSGAVQANAPGMNAAIAQLESQYPQIIPGPDLWSLFYGHSIADGWFSDSLHPSLSTGCDAFQKAWTNTMLSEIYDVNTSSAPPSVPTGLAASATTSTQVNLTWSPSTDLNYPVSSLTYTLYRNGAVVTTTAAGVTSYSDSGLAANTTYTYTVSASDPSGNTSAPSTAVNVTTPVGGGIGGGTPPVRRGGCAAETNRLPAKCTISGVQSGDEIVVGFLTEYGASNATISFSDNCGGTYTVLNQHAIQAGGAGVVVEGQGYGVGGAGICTISGTSTSGGGPGEIVADDITAGTLDTYGWLPDVPTTANGATSFGLNVNGADYIFSWATDVFGKGGNLKVASPFSIKNYNLNFPIYDADATTTGTGTVASTWTFFSNSSGTIGAIAFSGSGTPPPAPVITSPLTTSGTVGSAFSYQIGATENPTSYGATNLPAGLSITAATGLISGTPTAAGNVSSTIFATNSGGTGSATLAITIAPPPAPVITSPLTASGTVGSAFSYQIGATGNPTSYGATNLPAGLSITAATGLISGNPTAAGNVSSTISATNRGGTGSATLAITIAQAAPPPDNTSPTVPSGLSATAVSSSQVNLSWAASTDSDNTASQITYTLYRYGAVVTTTAAGVTSYSDSGLTANTSYTYTVSASDPAGNTSAPSAAVNVTTLASSGNTPQRVRGCSGEAGAAKVSCTLTGVTAGDIIIVGAASLEAGTSPLAFSDNCGGRYTVLDTSNSSSDAAAQGYATGSSGTCAITAQTSGGWATTLVVEEITPSAVDVHGWNQNFNVSAGKTAFAAITTSSNDYVFSWAVDEAGDGGSHMTVSTPFVVHDFNNVFPIVDADTTQSAGGSITATWKFNATTSHAAIGMMGFH